MTDRKLIMFDLDGTLSESADGIKLCLTKALNDMGFSVPELDDYTKYIGPPLFTTFVELCGLTEQEAKRGVDIYIKHYLEEGMYINRAYPGIKELLINLKAAGKTVVAATSKNEQLAIDVLKHIGLYDCFDFICGSKTDGTRKLKRDVILYVMDTMGFNRNESVMIGDTKFDAEGAMLAGCGFIGVLYGYGLEAQMRSFGAEVFAHDVRELENIVLG